MRRRHGWIWKRVVILLAAVVIIAPLTATKVKQTSNLPVRSLKTELASDSDTQPSTTSAASLYLSNWDNIQAIWMAPQLNQEETAEYGPRIAELHYSGNWSVNQINDYTGFFIDETDDVKYDQAQDFATTGYLDQDGVLNGTYGDYNGSATPIEMSRDFVLVPNEPFMVTRYTLTNPSSTTSYNWNVLDQVHLNNTDTSDDVTGSYSSSTDTLYADMTASGQYVVFLGAMQTPGSYQVGNDADCTATDTTASAWCQFDANGTLDDNSSLSTPDMDLGFQDEVTIAPESTVTLYYYMGIASTLSAAETDAGTASGESGSYWYTQTATDYTNWLNDGKTISTSDTGVNTAYLRNLVVIKNSQNPGTGLFPATTNPGSYSYKAWVRDSSFDAMALDASGHYAEAEQFWEWMAANQLSNGTWETTYDLWTGAYISFVQPEYDSLGEFLVGVYQDYELSGNATFLSDVWPAVEASADFIEDNVGSYDLGPEDNSIWEQTDQYNTFTEAFYIAGLRAAAHLALTEDNSSDADAWNGAASTVLSAVQTSYSASPPGEWNDTTGYYDQGVTSSGSPDTTIDSSSDELIALGDINADSERAASQISIVEQALTHDTWGIARYTGDDYYYTSTYSPAGDEAGSAEPVWPNMTMLVALYEIYTGDMTDAFSRLQWYASVSGVGYMPPGEAVSWETGQPVVSTMSEPFTAATFIMTSLAYTDQYDPRVYPTNANASAYATVDETTSPSNDWPQWRDIPYYDGNPAGSASGSAMTSITRVYAANDSTNLYLRVDNASGSLSAYDTSPEFGILVYAQDFDHSSSLYATTTGYYGGTLDHPMNYLFARWSDSDTYSMFSANSSGGWTFDANLSTQAPQWDTTTGRVELEVPLSDMASSSAAAGDWSYLDVEMAYDNNGTWQDDDITGLHYEIASSSSAWLYGNTLGNEIESLTTNLSRYSPGTDVTINADVLNPQAVTEDNETLTLAFTHDGAAVGSDESTTVSLAPGETVNYALTWDPPDTDYQGYLVQATLTDATGDVLDNAYTAVDVSQNWAKFPRYGFVTNFGDNYLQTLIANRLNLYHLDGIQFYDWEWKSHMPLAGTVSDPASSWVNIDENTNYMHSVQTLISDVHDDAAVAMNYNLIYGAWAGYGQDGSGVNYEWGLWWDDNCTDQVNISLSNLETSNLYVFDPGNTSWQSYIFGQEEDADDVYDFDGWQADQLGDEGTTYTCSGTEVDPETEFDGFLTNAYNALGGELVFNAVGQYGQEEVATNPDLEFLYTECWPANGQTTYDDLQNTIYDNNTWSDNEKSTVLAAYPDQAYGDDYTDSDPAFFNTPGVLYEDATIFASGGDHIELGDVDHMLAEPDYVSDSLYMTAQLQQAMVNYYNFLTAYEDLLRDGETPNSNVIDLPDGPTASTDGAAGTVWTWASSTTGTDVLQFVNFLNLTNTDWMDTDANQPAPTVQTDVEVKYYYTSSVAPASVYVASPDVNGGVAQSLSFTTGTDSGGNYVEFTLPSLDYWDMAWVNY